MCKTAQLAVRRKKEDTTMSGARAYSGLGESSANRHDLIRILAIDKRYFDIEIRCDSASEQMIT